MSMTQPKANNGAGRATLTLDATRDEIFRELRSTMHELFELELSAITLEADLRKDLALDSIDAVDMAVRLQQLTGRKVPLSDLLSIRTVSDVIGVIEKHLAGLRAEGATSLPSDAASD